MSRARKKAQSARMQEAELVSITDPAQQAALDLVFKSGRITKLARKMLDEARKAPRIKQQKS
jgi:hypothetical protein